MRIHATLTCTTVLFLLVAGPAFGQGQGQGPPPDGPIGIDSCGTVLDTRGSYILLTSIDCSGDGLLVPFSGTTIDLGGHTINHVGGQPGVGIVSNGGAGVTIRNGNITNFTTAIDFSSDVLNLSGNKVENVTVGNQVGSGPAIALGDNSVVSDSTVRTSLPQDGAAIVVGENSIVRNSVVLDGGAGNVTGRVLIQGGDGSLLQGNNLRMAQMTTGMSAGVGSSFSHNVVVAVGAPSNSVGVSATCPSLVTGNSFAEVASGVDETGGVCTVSNNAGP